MLAAITPLVLIYEVGSAIILTNPREGTRQRIEAERLLGGFFEAFGVAGLLIPGLALVTVLLAWQVISRDKWRVNFRFVGMMLAESVAWTLPLLVLAAAHSRAAAMVTPLMQETGGANLGEMSTAAKMTVSIGAGLYEEMLFRLVGLALLHLVLVDLIGLPQKWGAALAVGISAIAFALYHQPRMPEEWTKAVFFTISGVYLGTVYVMRGFGIVVWTHAIYDVMVLVLLE